MTDCGGTGVVTVGTAKPETASSGVDAGSVGSSAVAVPAMFGHQHGAWDPAPWCIDDGIASWWGQAATLCRVDATGPPRSQQGSAKATRRRNERILTGMSF